MIRTRNDLIEWLESNAPYPRIKRALLRGGTNENLGGFRYPFYAEGRNKGWVVKITSKGGTVWHVLVVPSTQPIFGAYHCWYLAPDEVRWQWWDGDESKNPLYTGDHPEKYKENRDAARLSRPDNAEQDT